MQYLYITNLNGDVVGITDENGDPIAEYTYDEWGKLLAITTAEENNEEQLSIANLNPLRYRGYYYDNETGMYYLQSRYYNPEIGRFISADGFEYLDTTNKLSANAYAYCWNSPVAFSDAEGTTPELAIDMEKLTVFLKNATTFVIEKIQERFQNLQSKFNAFVEKTKFYLKYPDVVINKMLSNLLGREVNLRFRLVELLRDTYERNKAQQQESAQGEDYGIAPYYVIAEDEKTSNPLEAIFKALSIGIPAHFLFTEFEAWVQISKPEFDFNEWFKKLSESMQDFIVNIGTYFSTLLHTAWIEGQEYIEEFFLLFSFDKIFDWLIDSSGASFYISSLISFTSAFNDRDEGKYTTGQAWISTILNIILTAVSIFVPMEIGGRIGMDVLSFTTNFVLDGTFNFSNGHLWGY